MSKYIFFSGKGGVGKTSAACATAYRYASQGNRTIIVTTDPAPNLSDVFGQKIGHKVTAINGIDNLWAIEIDPDKAAEEYREKELAPVRELFDDDILKLVEEQLNSPCTEEIASFDKFVDFVDNDDYDVVIFDTAPTGHTLRLLELPVDWSAFIDKSAKGTGQTCMGPVENIIGNKEKYDRAIKIMRDKSCTRFIFVLKPEATAVAETKRAIEELKTIGIAADLLIVNGIYPEEECTDPFFKKLYNLQLRNLDEIKKIGLQYIIVPLFDEEVKGLNGLRRMADALFKGEPVR